MKSLMYSILAFSLLFAACEKSDIEPEVLIEMEEEEEVMESTDFEFTCISDQDTEDVLTNACPDNWTCTYDVYQNAAVTIEQDQAIVGSGDKIIIRMASETEGDYTIADDEIYNTLIIGFESDMVNFSLFDEDLSQLDLYYLSERGFSIFQPVFNSSLSGCIEGLLLEDGSWQIQGDLTFEDYFPEETLNVKLDVVFNE